MARVIEDLCVYIAANTTFVEGDNLWGGRLPPSPDTVICLFEPLGFEPPTETFGASGNFGWERPQVQVISRAAKNDYPTARDNSEIIYKVLRSVYEATTGINGTKYHMIIPRSTPYFQGEDDNSRLMISFTCDVWKDPSS